MSINHAFKNKTKKDHFSKSIFWILAFSLLYLFNLSAYSANPTAWKSTPTSSSITLLPGDSQTFITGASDSDGDLSGCEWYLNGSNVAVHSMSGNSDTDGWSKTFSSPETFIVECVVYDSNWNYSSAAKWTVTVGNSETNTIHEFFDDFYYSKYNDNELINFGWNIVDGVSGPPANANYKKENITFETDPNSENNKFILLKTKTSNSFGSMELARIESKKNFLEGTYAAKVYFDNTPATYNDGNIETFYCINTLRNPNDPDYSECDFEYLPYDIWGGGDYRKKMYLTTWETFREEPWDPNNASTPIISDFSGWHTLLFQATNGQTVQYFIDGVLQSEHTLSNKNDSVYPETLMQIAFANWISPRENNTGLGASTSVRTCTMKVDWVYHSKDTELNTAQVESLINDFRSNSIKRRNTMELRYDVSTNANPTNGGTLSGAGQYISGSTANLMATASTGYKFVNWTENGTQVSTDANYSFTVTTSKTLVANFDNTVGVSDASEDIDINIYPNPANGKVAVEGKNIKTIEVFNVYGKIIKEIKVSSDKTLIYSDKLAKGIYIFKLTTDDKILTTKILLN